MKKWITKSNASFAMSVLALIVAYCSYEISSDALEYEKQREVANKSPAIILNSESNKIQFKLDKENARLQTVIFKFPDALRVNPLITEGDDQHITIAEIEGIVCSFFSERISKDNEKKEIRIPVVIDYEAVVDRNSTLYREDHFLVFKLSSIEGSNSIKLVYERNRFNYGLICPQEYNKKEGQKLKNYLDDRFSKSMSYYKYIGLIK